MNRSAKVHSIDALDQMSQAVRSFAQEAMGALDDVKVDLHRATQWLQYEQKDYWGQQSRRAQEAVAEARLALERKRMFRFGDQEPSCHEEKKALEAAKRRVELSRQKLEAIKRWTRLLEQESHDCRTGIAPLADWIVADVPRALAMLHRLSLALESYIETPGAAPSLPAASLAAQPSGAADAKDRVATDDQDGTTTDKTPRP